MKNQSSFNFLSVIYFYIENFMKKSQPTTTTVFLSICYRAWAHYSQEPKPLTNADIMDFTGQTRPVVTQAVKELEDNKLIYVTRKRGRGSANLIEINPEAFQEKSLWKDSFRKDSLGKENRALHGFEMPLFLESPAPEQPTGAATPPRPAEPPATVENKRQRKTTDEEKQAFTDVWALFESELGKEPMRASSKLVSKSIWDMVRKKSNGNGGLAELKEMVVRFIGYTKRPPKEFSYLRGQRPLPNVMNSERTWLRMTLPAPEEARASTVEENEAMIEDLRKKGVIR